MGEGQDEGEKFRMRSWLIAQYELSIKNHSGIIRIDPHAAFKVSAEDKNSYLNPSLRGGQPFFGWTTWQSHEFNPSF
jgi:hypothetical protein